MVGTDHAGIATQMVVERNLAEPGHQAHRHRPRGLRRAGLGMEGGVGRHDHPPAAPPRRLVRLGARALHDGRGLLARPCTKVFVDALQAQGLHLPRQAAGELGPAVPDRDLRSRGRDARDPRPVLAPRAIRSRTAPASSRSRPRGRRRCSPTWRSRCIPRTSATRALIGKQVRLPITGRLIPIVADEHADPELGSGAVKITPGHDFNDFEVGKRAGFSRRRDAQHARCRRRGSCRPPTG